MKQLIVLSIFFWSSCSSIISDAPIDIGFVPEDNISFQKKLIAQLSGHDVITTALGDTCRLKSRWNHHERHITQQYLRSVLSHLNLEYLTHDYVLPNSNAGVDVLIEPLKGKNVYTILPATQQSDKYLIIGAHYDTDGKGFPGAIDNGSGVALITGVLRKAMKLSDRSMNLMVVYFDQEEENISAGSIAFARYLKTKEYNIHSVHCYDLIGWDSDNNREVQIELPSESIEALYRKHADQSDTPIFVTQAKSSDYYSFIKEGFNAVGMSQAYAKGDISGKKDSPEDQYHLVNFEYLDSCTELAYQVIKDILEND